jgi:diguanylate cyclase (GGDEF)-like protein
MITMLEKRVQVPLAIKMSPPTQNEKSQLFVLISIAGITALVMFLFEDAKQLILPHVRIWQSHALTITFTSMLATGVAYFVTGRLTLINAELEIRISERTSEIEEANRKLKVDSHQLTILSRMGEALQTCRDIEEISAVIREFGQQAFTGASGTLWTISESRNIVEAVTSWGGSSPVEQVFAPEDCWALRQGRLHLVKTASGRVCRHIGANGAFPSLCVPLMAHGETLGLLHIQGGISESGSSNAPPDAQIESTKQFTTAMARHIALALANLKLSEKLRNQSIRDALTGLFNRRYMEESLERELRRAVRNNQPVALLMIDIDHFKQFNDTFGHQAGDTLLRAFGNFLKQRTRGQDVACRYGGEEFVLILSDAAIEGACQRAEILRKELTELMVQHAGQPLAAISISIGVAACPKHGTTAEELVRAADQALYHAKVDGRDRVVVA